MSKGISVRTERLPSTPPPEGRGEREWYQTYYWLTCGPRTYAAWSYEQMPASVNIIGYWEDGAEHKFQFIPYQDSVFCRIARHLISALGKQEAVVWCDNRPLQLDVRRLKR